MKNNNGAIVRKLTVRSFKSNKNRNIFVKLAIMLTTILITAVFSIGTSFLETSALQQIRFLGTSADAYIDKLTDSKLEKLKTIDYIKSVGLEQSIGNMKNTPKMSKRYQFILHWYDKTQWEEFRYRLSQILQANILKNIMRL